MTGSFAPAPPEASAWEMYRALVGVGLACGLLIVTVYEITRPIIRRNEIEARERAILEVLPGARTSAVFRLAGGGFAPAAEQDGDGGDVVFAGYGEGGRLVGLAIEARGMGYQDIIRLIYGYSLELQAIVGMRVLESRETPGLGDRIATDRRFLANFEQLDVSLDASGERPEHAIRAVKQGKKSAPWEVDGITGATISAVAVADILRKSTASWIPRVARARRDFEREQ